MRKFIITAKTNNDEANSVTFTAQGSGARAWANFERTLGGSRWEGADNDPDFAYTSVCNWNGLRGEIEYELFSYIKESKVEIDWSMYSVLGHQTETRTNEAQ